MELCEGVIEKMKLWLIGIIIGVGLSLIRGLVNLFYFKKKSEKVEFEMMGACVSRGISYDIILFLTGGLMYSIISICILYLLRMLK